MIRGVLFDLDGTLFDRATSLTACIEAQHGRQVEILRVVSAQDYVTRFVELDARGYMPKDRVYQQIVADYALADSAAHELFRDFYAHYHEHAVPFPHLHATLTSLRDSGLRLGIVTNGGEAHQRATVQALGIGRYFDAILISDSEGVRKPEATIFHRAAERLGLTVAEALFVGDHPVVDIQGAHNAGTCAVWKRDSYWGGCPDADAIVDDLRSLPTTISALSVYLSRDNGLQGTPGCP
jgi:putative hydrolase of the HAD superfamily